MPVYSLKATNGKTYDIEGPAGATEAQVREQILSRDPSAAEPPKPPEPGLLRRGYEGLKSAASYPFELAGKLDVASGIKTPEQAASRAKTYGGIAVDTALTAPITAGVGSLGTLAADALGFVRPTAAAIQAGAKVPWQAVALPAAGRVAGAAAGGAAQAGLEGRPMGKDALISGLAAGALEGGNIAIPKAIDVGRGAVGKLTGAAAKRAETEAAAQAGQKATEKAAADMAKRTLASREAHRVGTEAESVLPGLGVKGPDLHKLTLGGEGRQILNAQFKQSLEGVDKALRAARITKIKVPELSDQPMTVREAVDALQLVGKGMGQAPAGARSVGQRFAALDYGAAREALVSRLNAVVPGAGDQLSAALGQSARGRAYLKLVGQSLGPDGQLDPAKLARNVNKYAGVIQEKFGPKAADMTRVLTGGRPIPMPVPKPIAGPAWRPPPIGQTPTSGLGPAGMLAADVLGSQPGAREAVVGAGMSLLPGSLPPQLQHMMEVIESGG